MLVPGKPGLYQETLSQINKNKRKKSKKKMFTFNNNWLDVLVFGIHDFHM